MRAKRALKHAILVVSILGWACAAVAIAWAEYKMYSKHEVMPRKAFKIITTQIAKGYYGADYWKDIKTVEEAWAGKGLLATPPYYYEKLEQHRDQCDDIGYLDHPAYLKPYSELTRKERLLLCRSIPIFGSWNYPHEFSTDKMDYSIIEVLISASKAGESAADKTRDFQMEIAAAWLAHDKLSFYSGKTKDDIERDIKEAAAALASPISGKVIAPYMKDFSPGDAYCLRITDRRALVRLYARDSHLHRYFYPSHFSARQYMYYRIYGEKGVIAEGMCLVRPEEDD